jgi:hypothetical protein
MTATLSAGTTVHGHAPRRPAAGAPPGSQLDHIAMPRAGLNLPRDLPFDTWLRIGRHLSVLATSSAWCLGDWLVYGEAAYSGRYRDAIERTSLDYQTLRNYAWVARCFSLSRRRDRLSFSHHLEVAALPEPEQDFWLRKAEEHGWSRNRLRREVRSSLSQRSASGETDTDLTPIGDKGAGELRIKLKLTPGQLELCEKAAVKEGLSVECWAAAILEHAAQSAVEGERPACSREAAGEAGS